MKPDPIVDEVREIREGIAREYNYDIQAIVEALMAQQVARGDTVFHSSASSLCAEPARTHAVANKAVE